MKNKREIRKALSQNFEPKAKQTIHACISEGEQSYM